MKYLLGNSVTLITTIKKSVHENSPILSTRVHLLCPREFFHPRGTGLKSVSQSIVIERWSFDIQLE